MDFTLRCDKQKFQKSPPSVSLSKWGNHIGPHNSDCTEPRMPPCATTTRLPGSLSLGNSANAKHQVTLSSKQPNIVRRIERLSGLAFCARRFTRVRDSQLYSDGDVPHFMGMPPTCPLANTPSSLHQQYSCLIPYRSRLQMSIHLVHKESPAIRTRTAHYTSVGAISPRRRPAARGTAGTSTRARTSAQSTRRGTHARSAPPPLPRPRHGTAPDTRRTCRHAFRAA